MDKCNCYQKVYGKAECWGTKEKEKCSCGGDETKCNFLSRKTSSSTSKKKVMEDFKKNRKYTYEETNVLRLVYVLDATEGLTDILLLVMLAKWMKCLILM